MHRNNFRGAIIITTIMAITPTNKECITATTTSITTIMAGATTITTASTAVTLSMTHYHRQA